jgi:hypothetical protein
MNLYQLRLAEEEGLDAVRMAKRGYGVAAEVARHAAHLAFIGCDYLGEGEYRDPYLMRPESKETA